MLSQIGKLAALWLLLGGLWLSLDAQTATQAQTPGFPAQFECNEDLRGETIRFFHFGDLSGPFSALTLPVVTGFDDAVDYFNAHGGVCGAQIEQVFADTGADPNVSQSIWDDFAGQDDAHVVFVYQTEDAELLRPLAEQARIPVMVSTGSVRSLYGDDGDAPGWVFAITPLYEDQMGGFCDYIAAHWDDFGLPGEPTIGHVSWSVSFGTYSDTPATRAYCEALGVGYAGAEYYFPIVPNITPLVENMLQAGANILYTTSVADGPARLASTVDSLGVREDVLLAGPNWVLDPAVVRLAGESADGYLGQLPYRWWDEVDNPGIQTITAYWADNRLADSPQEALEIRGLAYLIAFAAVDAYRNVMIDAINTVGYENLSGAALYERLTGDTTYHGLGDVLRFNFHDGVRSTRNSRMGQLGFIGDDEVGLRSAVDILTDWQPLPDLRLGGADVPEE